MAKKNSGASAADKKFDPVKAKPYNRYNIYFILERERLLQANPNYNRKDACAEICITGYENMDLPHHPKQYEHLDLAADWYMPGKRKAAKRDHKKSHGLISFQEIARHVADGWKTIDDETLEYCSIVAEMLKQRHKEMKNQKDSKLLSSSVEMAEVVQPNYASISGYHETQEAYSNKHSHHSWAASVPSVSDLHIESSSRAAGSCCTSDSTLKTNEYEDVREDETSVGTSTAKEVDIPDQDILDMWHVN